MTFRYTRNGKLRFLRIHRLCLSFCIAKPAPRVAPTTDAGFIPSRAALAIATLIAVSGATFATLAVWGV